MQSGWRRLVALLICLMLVAGISLAAAEAVSVSDPEPLFQFHQIEVGMGQAHLVVYGDWGIMIDGGLPNEETWGKVKPYLEACGIRYLKAYIATHWHLDHTGNMNPILEMLANDETVVYGSSEVVYEAKEPIGGGHYEQMKVGDVIRFGPVTLSCIGPGTVSEAGRVNRDSLNIIISYGSRRFMITGDFVNSRLVYDTYEELLPGIDVFQFPHHGLRNYCVDPFVLLKMKPSYVLVPGNGAFRPKEYFLNFGFRSKWLDNGSGNIVFLTDGESLELYTKAGPGDFAGR